MAKGYSIWFWILSSIFPAKPFSPYLPFFIKHLPLIAWEISPNLGASVIPCVLLASVRNMNSRSDLVAEGWGYSITSVKSLLMTQFKTLVSTWYFKKNNQTSQSVQRGILTLKVNFSLLYSFATSRPQFSSMSESLNCLREFWLPSKGDILLTGREERTIL